ncbi:hypothetical protein, partial [Riemerella anatipestifer]|uniref:hypothetical protein n=1 Tax=Riemerella anatipestifer TaxID=34085 RepID=UPI003D9CAB76
LFIQASERINPIIILLARGVNFSIFLSRFVSLLIGFRDDNPKGLFHRVNSKQDSPLGLV